MRKYTTKEIFSIPNIMCYFRIILIPVFCYLYINANYAWAFGVFLISALTDLFDGKIARKFNMVTELGKMLDPIADKLNHFAMAFCLALRYPLMWVLIVLFIVKEGYMGFMEIKFIKKGKMPEGAMWFGKLCTAVLFAGMLVLLLFYNMNAFIADLIILVMMAFMIFSLAKYVLVFREMKKSEA